jgi:hypothetical protein
VTGRAYGTKRLSRAGRSGAGAAQWGALRGVLRLPDVRRLELGWGLSLVGEFASTIALFVYAFDEGGATLVAVYGVARAAPGAIVTPALLGLTDRLPADRLLRATTGARATLVALAGAAAGSRAARGRTRTRVDFRVPDGDVPAGPGHGAPVARADTGGADRRECRRDHVR